MDITSFWSWRPWKRGGKGWRGGWGWQGGAVPSLPPQQIPENAVPLERLPAGSRARVVAVLAGMGATSRAYQMGIAPGAIVEVVENNLTYPWTPILVRVHSMTIALGRGLASRILVVPLGRIPSGGSVEDRSGIREG